MKKHFFIFFSVISLSIIFTTLSCKQNTESGESGGSYPILKISSAYDGYIYRVGLAGYSFDDLRIENNEDKVFELKNGIPGGNSNVNVLTNGFQKKSQKTPPNEIEVCKIRKADYLKRKEAKK